MTREAELVRAIRVEADKFIKRLKDSEDDDLRNERERYGYMRARKLFGPIEKLLAAYEQAGAPLSANEEQRRSFVYGNLAIDNPNVTRDMVDRAADEQADVDSVPEHCHKCERCGAQIDKCPNGRGCSISWMYICLRCNFPQLADEQGAPEPEETE